MPYTPGVLELRSASGGAFRLATADAATAHVVRDDFKVGDWLFSRIWLEDEAGTAVPCVGQEVDVSRDGWELVAAGSEGISTWAASPRPIGNA